MKEGIWFPIEVKVSQSDAETPLSHTSAVICCIMGKLAFVTGNIVLTENGTSGKSIIVELPAFLKASIETPFGTAVLENVGSWSYLFSVRAYSLLQSNKLLFSKYDDYRNAGVSPSFALAPGDYISLSLMIALE